MASCVCRISPSGELVLFEREKQMATVGFGIHVKGWNVKHPQLIGARDAQCHIKEPTLLHTDSPPLYSTVVGNSSTINVSTFMLHKDGGVEIEVQAFPTEDELEVCSVRLSVELPVAFWGHGLLIFTSSHHQGKLSLPASFSLPKEGDPIVDSCSLLEKAQKLYSVQTVDKFSFSQKDKISTLESTACNFVDLRQWCPTFEVRMGDLSGGFTWKKGDVKKWYARLEVCSRDILFEDPFSTTLTVEQKQKLKSDGYIHLPGVLSAEDVRKALRCVNQAIQAEGAKGDYSSKFTAAPAITDLVNFTQIRGILSDLLEVQNVPRAWAAQIALVFPKEPPATPIKHMGYHIDGEPNYKNESNWRGEQKLNNFTVLLGVYLNDTPEEDSGNFTVFPGTHLQHATYFKNHKPDSIVDQKGKMKLPSINMPEPVQIKPKAGDIVLAHYLTAHTVACNVSSNIRYALYFRLHSPLTQATREQSLTEVWSDWPGLHFGI